MMVFYIQSILHPMGRKQSYDQNKFQTNQLSMKLL